MINIPVPDSRLQSAIPYLKKGGRVIDVGTDHAYLPIYLVKQGIVGAALACDINRGPIDSARANIAAAGFTDRISTLQTDGLHGTEAFTPDDVMIFGMGGELIVKILSEAPWIRTSGIGLILQPMSRAHVLRRWLTENGFAIMGETLTHVDKYYQTIAARYAPDRAERYDGEECILGKLNILDKPPLFEGFLRHEIGVYEAILNGKAKSAHADTRDETRILNFLKQRLETLL
ncbi:MAG: SAM-dependent methyltransferase [Clostridia bacterium]|nr:SAM-dependent methyltransferase [Clostridia bacterium]